MHTHVPPPPPPPPSPFRCAVALRGLQQVPDKLPWHADGNFFDLFRQGAFEFRFMTLNQAHLSTAIFWSVHAGDGGQEEGARRK